MIGARMPHFSHTRKVEARMYVLADKQIHEVERSAEPLYSTVCGKLVVSRRLFQNPPIRLSYCRRCFEAYYPEQGRRKERRR